MGNWLAQFDLNNVTESYLYLIEQDQHSHCVSEIDAPSLNDC